MIVAALIGANCTGNSIYASEVKLAWNPSPDATGYLMYSVIEGSGQTNITDVGATTNAIIQNLVAGQAYTFFATAYDTNRVESDPSNSVTFTAGSVSNRPPTLQPIPNQLADEGRPLQITMQASDPDPGQTVFYSLGTNVPTGATINTNTGVFTWTPTASQAPSTNQITLIATDSGTPAMTASATFTVVVRPGMMLALNTAGTQNLIKGAVQVSPRGTLNPEGTKYVFGTSVSAAAQPDTGAYFSHWVLNGVTYNQNPLPFSMDGNKTLTAYFGAGSGGIKLTSASTATATSTTESTETTALSSTTISEPTNTYVLESSTNLVEWTEVTNVVATTEVDTNSVFRIRAAE